jgi:alpha-N-arabinofuranosidase
VAAALTVGADRPGAAISPTLHGVFFEDINFAADGGLYPERVKNGSFEFIAPLMGWKRAERGGAAGTLLVLGRQPLNDNNPHYLRLTVEKAGHGPGAGFGLENEGFRGIGMTRGAGYTFSVFARSPDARPPALHIELVGHDGQRLAAAELRGFTGGWNKYSCPVRSAGTDPKARLVVLAEGAGTLDLDMVSLFPQDTWGGRPNGLRPDLVQLLRDLKPGFVRFPGGCIVEGATLATRYRWKDTIGPLEQRRVILNRWNNEYKARPAPDYFQSYGLGFYEYFLLCEDIGARPLPVLNCGMACQFNSGELAPLDRLGPYVQDALDLIEFANGPADRGWGARRAALGHPAPFHLDMLGIGNEQWGPQYIERYQAFARAIRARYPHIKLVAGAGPKPNGKEFDFAWETLPRLNADIIDEHYYRPPAWFLANVHRYDRYDRRGPKVFAGEFAAHSVRREPTQNRNDWNCALSEAAFMTGLERNADVVVMASYAPLLAHVDAWQWRPDLIWFDNLRSFGTPSYYVQKLFSASCGRTVLPAKFDGPADGLFACASRADNCDVILKAVNMRPTAVRLPVKLDGIGAVPGTGAAQVLACPDLKAENSLREPAKVAPVTSTLTGLAAQFERELPPHSLTVIRIHTRGKSTEPRPVAGGRRPASSS